MSSLTRKHYNQIAEMFREADSYHFKYPASYREYLRMKLGYMFERDNPNFDWKRWDAATERKDG